MFEKTLTDLIRGLRANKKDEQRYIQSAIVECKKEARSQDLDIKAGALLKLTYLSMFGEEMSWASFYTVEVMASPRFVNKRIGYMAASQGFRQDTDVLMLATNLIKKDISSASPSEVSVALGGLGDIVTPELARDLSHDLVSMLSHSKATVRRKAVLVMYKIFLQYPEALRSSYPKLRECLEDSDQSVVSATINVIVELSRKNPKNYLPIAPQLFELLTSSTNNWMSIKIIKVFATLTPLEPRLVKKLIPPLTELIQTTSAMSLLYECINTVISGDMLSGPNSGPLAQLCIMKLRTFFEQDDQNLKYVGLIAFTKVIETHPDMVSRHQDVILKCIDDTDISIKLRALELISLMPSRKSLPEIVKRLVKQLLPSADLALPPTYRRDLIYRLLKMCSSENYKHIEDFDWYMAVLVDLSKIAEADVGNELRDEIRNVCVRVKSVREFAVPILARLLCNKDMLTQDQRASNTNAVLSAATWAVGEYSDHLEDSLQTMQDVLAAPFEKLTPAIQCSFLQAIPKLYCRWTRELEDFKPKTKTEVLLQTQKLQRVLQKFTSSNEIEVQRRAVELVELFMVAEQCIEEPSQDEDSSNEVPLFFTEILPNLYCSGGDLNPVAATAQAQIPVPQNLDLDSRLIPLTPEPSPIITPVEVEDEPDDLDEDTLEERRKARRNRNKDDPYYIHNSPSPSLDDEKSEFVGDVNLDTIPVVSLDDSPPLTIKRKKRRPRTEPVEILTDEVPEGLVAPTPPDYSRPSSAVPSASGGGRGGISGSDKAVTNVLRIDGSKLSALNLDDGAGEEDEQFEAYQVVNNARAAQKSANPEKSKKEKKVKKDKKEKKVKKKTKEKQKEETHKPDQEYAAMKEGALSMQSQQQESFNVPSRPVVNTAFSSEPDIIEVIKKKKKKPKAPVELI